MARRWTVAAGACLATTLLAGCSGSTPQANTTLPTTSAPATASPTLPPLGPADFPVPAEARQKTPAGVAAFSKYYVDLMSRQAVSLDSAPLLTLSRSCQTCTAVAHSYDELKRAGQHYEGGAFAIVDTGSSAVSQDTGQTSFVLQQEPIKVRASTGEEVPGRTHPLTRYTAGCRLVWDPERSTWLMAQFDADPL